MRMSVGVGPVRVYSGGRKRRTGGGGGMALAVTLLVVELMWAHWALVWTFRVGLLLLIAAPVIGFFRRAGRRQPLPRPRTTPPRREAPAPTEPLAPANERLYWSDRR